MAHVEFFIGDIVLWRFGGALSQGPGTIFSKNPDLPGTYNYGVQNFNGNSVSVNPDSSQEDMWLYNPPVPIQPNIPFPLGAGTEVRLIDNRTGTLDADIGGISVSVGFTDSSTQMNEIIQGGQIAEVLAYVGPTPPPPPPPPITPPPVTPSSPTQQAGFNLSGIAPIIIGIAALGLLAKRRRR